MVDSLIQFWVAWGPLFLIFSIWIFIVWRQGHFKKGAITNRQYIEEMLTETKRHNETLEKLLAQYEERLTRLENKSDGTAKNS
ncbi:MAG: hypothetical protein P8Y67_08090 [Alphaproteobacteria bacterium]